MHSFNYAIHQVATTPINPEIQTPEDFLKSIKSVYLDYYKPIFFIFDQFEELFIFGSSKERKDFIDIIKALIDSEIICHVIFVLREEYLAI